MRMTLGHLLCECARWGRGVLLCLAPRSHERTCRSSGESRCAMSRVGRWTGAGLPPPPGLVPPAEASSVSPARRRELMSMLPLALPLVLAGCQEMSTLAVGSNLYGGARDGRALMNSRT